MNKGEKMERNEYGYPIIKTSNIDKINKMLIKFDKAHYRAENIEFKKLWKEKYNNVLEYKNENTY
jgi:hypothetical protein